MSGFLPGASGITITGPITGGVKGGILVESAANVLAEIAAVAAGSVLVSNGLNVPPVYSASPSVSNITVATQVLATLLKPATPATVGLTGTVLDLISGQGAPGDGVTQGGLGADWHGRAGAGGTDGGAGLGFGGSMSLDCGIGLDRANEPHFQLGVNVAKVMTIGRVGTNTSLTLQSTSIVVAGPWSQTGASHNEVLTGAYTLTAGAPSSILITGSMNTQASGNNQITSSAGSLDLVANTYRLFSAGIALAGTMVPSTGNLGFDGNFCVGGVNTSGATAAKTLVLGNGATEPTTSVDRVHLYSKDASVGNATLGIFTEMPVAVDVKTDSTHTLSAWFNVAGVPTLLKIMLST